MYFPRLEKVAPAAESEFRWPYYLFAPVWLEDNRIFHKPIHLLIVPNNTGIPADDPAVDDKAARVAIFPSQLIFGDLDVAVLVPAFPRPASELQYYTHALDRDTLLADRPDLRRIDLQLEAMIDDAANRLSRQGWTVDRKVLMFGFSASGMFVNRFAVLHPDRILAAAIGSPGGWPIAPVAEWGGRALRYPVGIGDLTELIGSGFDLDAFRRVPMLFFIGDRDENDSVPHPDGYDSDDRDLVFDLFGRTPLERWDDAEAVYRSIGADAEFRSYPGVGHSITLEEYAAIRDFFARILAGESAGR